MASSVAVAARDLTKRYRDVEAVRSISFDVPAETCFGFLGPNGAGKTTTMRMISCALPPTSGRLDVLGISATRHPRRVKSRMGVVPQEDNLDEEVTVLDNLLIHARYHGLKPKNARSTALELLDFMELIEKKDSEIRELSGGMKRRLMIARGLLNAPEILILDEPTTGLDPQARHLVWERLRSLKRRGVTLLLTTHYMEEAAQLCDRLVIMNEGRIIVEGPPRDVVAQHTSPEVVEVFEPPRDAQSQLDSMGDMAQRVEKLADRWLFYTDNGDVLREKIRALALPPGSVWLRGGTLEDVFLALTGRGLLD
jgi:lipooligosaccharide transport system ATP-binding protein